MAAITIKRRIMALERLSVKPVTKVMTIAFARDDGVLTNRQGEPIPDPHTKRLLVIHTVKP